MTNILNKVWPQISLSDVFWFQEGPGIRTWQFTSSGIKLLNVANITAIGELDLSASERYLSEEEVETRYRHFLADVGDLVIASSGISFDEDGHLRTRGAFVERQHLPLCMNTSTIRFKAKDDLSDLLFLKYWLDSEEFRSQISQLVTGSAQQNFGPSHLNQILISLPPLDEQRRIAAILRAADDERRRRRYTQSLSDSLLRETFVQMFGDPVTNPMGWEVTTLGDVIVSANDGPHVSPEYVDKGIPFLSTRNVRPGQLIWDDLKYISLEDAQIQWKKVKPERDDILYTKGGTTGLAKAVDFDLDFAVWVHIAVLKLWKDKVVPLWLESMLNSDYCYAQSQELTMGIVNHDLGLQRMPKIKMYLPPYELQEHFATIASVNEQTQRQQQESARQTEHLFQTLLHRAFRGEL